MVQKRMRKEKEVSSHSLLANDTANTWSQEEREIAFIPLNSEQGRTLPFHFRAIGDKGN